MNTKKRVNAKEKRETRKNELKEKFKSLVKKKEVPVEENANNENNQLVKDVENTSSIVYEDTSIESSGAYVPVFLIEAELKQSKQDKKAGKSPKTISIGKYIDVEMRDRAFEAIKESVSKKHEVKDAGTDNRCFIVSGVDTRFEEFRTKVYKTDIDMNVNLLDRNKISRLFDVEV